MSTAGISTTSLWRVLLSTAVEDSTLSFSTAVDPRLATFCVAVMDLALLSINSDLPRPCGLVALNGDLEHAVAVLGLDALRVDVIRQRDHAPEFAIEALAPVVLGFLVHLHVPGSGDR